MLPHVKRVLALDENQPDFQNHRCPVHIRTTMKHNEVLYVAGRGPRDTGVMFITPTLEDEEATSRAESVYNMTIREDPEVLKGGIGNMLKEAARMGGVDLENHYTTAFIKWLLPKEKRNRPDKEAIAWAMPALLDEIREIKPKIIVCFGKLAFDNLVPLKINQTDALGAWFWSPAHQARVFLMDKPVLLLMKPEKLETFRMLFKEVKNMIDRLNGVIVDMVEPKMQFIRTMEQLRSVMQIWREKNIKLFSVDCEWGGNNFIDGKLRSFQIGWSKEEGVCLTFMNSKREYVFDASYAEVGKELATWLNAPDVKYIGHFVAADLPWMHHWLGLDWYDKVAFDTAFGNQTVDESAGMGLEILSMAYTTFGRYDFDLMMWRKNNRTADDAGFADIPDEIIEPYSVMDVLVPFAAMPFIQQRLAAEDLNRYFYEMLLPFVSNVFASFTMNGLHMDVPKMDELREMFHFAKEKLNVKFQKLVHEESWVLLARAMQEKGDIKHLTFIAEAKALMRSGKSHMVVDAAKNRFGAGWSKYKDWLEHCISSPDFNGQSKPQMLRWLFRCKGLTPVKSTDNKEKGLRSMPWEKVMELPIERQGEFTPATDKQTLTILSEQAPIITKLLELKDIENLCKAFLKEATIDDETGEVMRENGLHYYLTHDGTNRILPNSSLTETGRKDLETQCPPLRKPCPSGANWHHPESAGFDWKRATRC